MASSMLLGLFVVAVALRPFQTEARSVCTDTEGGNEYMCVDWSFGSELMSLAQFKHKEETEETVFFGLGSYGLQSDNNIGKCFKLSLESVSTPLITQVTNYGADINEKQFDMQTGGGGFGVWNACVGPTNKTKNEKFPCDSVKKEDFLNIKVFPQFAGVPGDWSQRCGGQRTRDGCQDLPQWPDTLEYTPMPADSETPEPDLRTLCERSFDWGVRVDNGNRVITKGERIPCPQALVDITELQRSDDSDKETLEDGTLTTTMDCCAPVSSYPEATTDNNLLSDSNKLRPCTQDGYTRS